MNSLYVRRAIFGLLCLLASGCDKPKPAEERSADGKPAKAGEAKEVAADKAPKDKLPDLAPLDTAKAKQVVTAIDLAPDDDHGVLAAKALAELEKDRLGQSFTRGLEATSEVSPDMRAAVVAKSILENIAMLDDACEADGRKTMESLATMDPTQRNAKLWEACQFDKLGLTSKEAGLRADPIAVLFAHMAFAKIQKHGAVDPNEKKLLQAVANTKEVEPEPAQE